METRNYDYITRKLRTFFQYQKGFVEVPSHSRCSILAACEDPKTITTYQIGGIHYPLPQTGQMWLEIELMKNPDLPGVFCVGPSYRDEPTLVPGRHARLFTMFEFESHGDMNQLRELEKELSEYLGLGTPHILAYEEGCTRYATSIIDHAAEQKMEQEFGSVISLEYFPRRTDPFWNMKRNEEGIYNKIDLIIGGMETIGSAERSTDVEQMRHDFLTVSHGNYAQLLFAQFGHERVMQELDEYLALPMFERFGGGIGLMRLEAALIKAHLMPHYNAFVPAHHLKWQAVSL